MGAGTIVAGPHVRAACARHLRDLKDGKKRGLYFDLEAANRAIGFFRDVLRLNGGEFEGVPYVLLPWQAFVVGSLFGWMRADGTRRFRMAYIETAKGSGKSPLAAGIGHYGLVADKEARAEIYAAATKRDQAMVLFRDAVAMVDQSTALASRLQKSGTGLNVWNLAYLQTGSFFRPISAADGQSGPRPHFSLVDEVHEHVDSYVIDMLKAGQKGRRQPLTLMITNSGTDKKTVCGGFHDYGVKVCAGQMEDDSFFAYICALDQGEDPFADEACWPKANPSLGVTIRHDYLREQITLARGMPSAQAMVRRLNFCQWVASASPWITPEVWFGCEDKDFDKSLLLGRKCWGGLDLSSTLDLTALALMFEPTDEDPVWREMHVFWTPEDTLLEREKKDKVPYSLWVEQGYLRTTPGKAINRRAVVKELAEIVELYDLQGLAYDRWRIEDLKVLLDEEGISFPMEPFGQGFKDMAPAVDEYERLLVSCGVKHIGNPVSTWCAANAVVVTDPAGNRKVSKEKATGRIDGVAASLMAAGIGVCKKAEDEEDDEVEQGYFLL